MSPSERQFVLENVRSSISSHNVQPFRIRFLSDSQWEIFAEKSRLLPITDPRLTDFWKSFGAFIETLDIVLERIGWEMKECIPTDNLESKKPLFAVADVQVRQNPIQNKKQNFELLSRRMSYRGMYQKKVKIESTADFPKDTVIKFITDPQQVSKIARHFDKKTAQFMAIPGAIEEVYHWMRLSPQHPKWKKDGVDSEALALNPVEAWFANQLLRPDRFKTLNSWGFLSSLTSQSKQIVSSSAVAVIATPLVTEIDFGRIFLRGWLHLTQMKLFGAPISALVEDAAEQSMLRKMTGLSSDLSIVTALRVGPWPKKLAKPKSARLSWTELEIK